MRILVKLLANWLPGIAVFFASRHSHLNLMAEDTKDDGNVFFLVYENLISIIRRSFPHLPNFPNNTSQSEIALAFISLYLYGYLVTKMLTSTVPRNYQECFKNPIIIAPRNRDSYKDRHVVEIVLHVPDITEHFFRFIVQIILCLALFALSLLSFPFAYFLALPFGLVTSTMTVVRDRVIIQNKRWSSGPEPPVLTPGGDKNTLAEELSSKPDANVVTTILAKSIRL